MVFIKLNLDLALFGPFGEKRDGFEVMGGRVHVNGSPVIVEKQV